VGKSNNLSSNMEDYLESIALLKKEKGIVRVRVRVRVRDVSRLLKVKTPSVADALNKLSKRRLIVHERSRLAEKLCLLF